MIGWKVLLAILQLNTGQVDPPILDAVRIPGTNQFKVEVKDGTTAEVIQQIKTLIAITLIANPEGNQQ